MKQLNFLIIPLFFLAAGAKGQSDSITLDTRHGEKKPMFVVSNMPYTDVKIGNSTGRYVLDYGTTSSSVDTSAFHPTSPVPDPGTINRFSNFDFFGSWGTVTLSVQDHSGVKRLDFKQGGILGIDFLSLNIFTLDYKNKVLYRANGSNFCPDSVLYSEGFKPLSTVGYFARDTSKIMRGYANTPTVPGKIGTVSAIFEIDPGFDDTQYHHSVNVNTAFFNALSASGITMEPISSKDSISTCVFGVYEYTRAYKMPKGTMFQLTGTDEKPTIITDDFTLIWKEDPPEAKRCFGIGALSVPAAQIGGTFLVERKSVVFDPFHQRVWLNMK
ncbi:MAG TPA: hypothetical protein VGN20_06530 [Mucilaginibacter sp.]|jgi:hypothetical protein